jgi:hypothetical protein
MNGKIIPYIEYHKQSAAMKDIDPANDCLVYIADRFELNIEQRYWLAFLYSTCYCASTVFYIYQEFPDFENVDLGRLERWWKANKNKCVFQTDRLRIKSNDQFVPTFKSYRDWIGKQSQQEAFYKMKTGYPTVNYDNAFLYAGMIKNVGRFTLFIYLEMVNLLTDFKCAPRKIEWKHASNCLKGLEYAMEQEDLEGFGHDQAFEEVMKKLKRSSIFSTETTLCAYAKYMKGQRYIGYYIDRQKKEIEKMKENVKTGVCWRVLDEFRKETYKSHPNLTEPI